MVIYVNLILDSVRKLSLTSIISFSNKKSRSERTKEANRMQLVKQVKLFGGSVKQFAHESASTKCTMKFSVFLPPNASETNKVPVLFYLAGLTCNDELLFVKASNAAKIAAARGIAIVTTDTRYALSQAVPLSAFLMA